MKNKFVIFAVMILGSLLVNWLIPVWWIFIPVLFLCGTLLPKEKASSFILGFAALFLLWFFYCFKIDQQNNQILSHRIIQLFHLPNSFLLIVVISILGGLLGGLASWCGNLFKKIYVK